MLRSLRRYRISGNAKRLSLMGRYPSIKVRSPYSSRHWTSVKEGMAACMRHSTRAVVGLVARLHALERAAFVCSGLPTWTVETGFWECRETALFHECWNSAGFAVCELGFYSLNRY